MRNIGKWMEFKGVKSMEHGVKLMDTPMHVLAAERGESLTAAGRDGDIWQSDNARDTVKIKRALRVDQDHLSGTLAWLTGSGLLRFEHEPNKAYEARITDEIKVTLVINGENPIYAMDVTFTCQPYRLLYPAAEPITITASGTSLSTQGNAPALPRIKITGSGDFSLTIGMQTMFFSDVETGIIVDCALMDAFDIAGETLQNNKVSEEFFEIQPGFNTVSWLTETETGTVTSVEITPRWRWL